MKIRNEDGTITVFLSIILLIVIALAATLVDGARINSANSQVRRAAQSAAQSTLANYNSELKEQYGLFALDGSNVRELTNTSLYYMEKSLNPEKDLPQVDLITQYFNENIYKNYYDKDFLDLYDYSIEDVTVSLYYDLEDNEVLKQQILEYMKYRGPKELISTFLKKLDILKKSGKTAELIKEKVEVEEFLDKVGDGQKKLSEMIALINTFDKTQVTQITLENTLSWMEEFNVLTEDIGTKKINLTDIETSLRDSENQKKNLESTIDSKEKSLNELIKNKTSKEKELESSPDDDDLAAEIKTLENQISSLSNAIDGLEDKLNTASNLITDYKSQINILKFELSIKKSTRSNIYNNIGESRVELQGYFEEFKKHNHDAKSMIKSLLQVSVDVQSEIEDFETKINSLEYKENIITEARYQIQYDLEDYEDKIKGVTQSSTISQFGDNSFNLIKIPDDIRNNVELFINSLEDEINNFSTNIEKSGLEDLIDSIAYPIASNHEILNTSITEINKLKNELDRIWWAIGKESVPESTKKFDNRIIEGSALLVNMIDKYSKEIRYVEFLEKEPTEEVKSYAEDMENRNTSQLDADESIDSTYKNKDFLQDSDVESSEEIDEIFENLPSKRDNNPDDIGIIIDNNKPTDSETIGNSLDFLINISKSIEEGTEGFRDSLYLNEYILGTFRCAVEANEGKIDTDFFGKYERSAYFDEASGNHEVEYIINGQQNPAKNLKYTQAQIYAIRTAMNMLHVYSDPDKMQIAIQLGTLASGPLPLLAPLITTVIVFGWSSLESLIDINMLMKGEEVPFYKISEEEWQLGLGGITSLIKDELVNEASEMVQDWAGTLIDRVVDGLFYQLEEGILELTVTVDTTAQDMFDEFENEINKRIDSVLEIIPNDIIKDEIKNLINPDRLISNIRAKISELLKEAGKVANGELVEISEEISSTLKNQIHSKLKAIKSDINEKLHKSLFKNDTFKSFVKNQGQDVLNEMTSKNFNLKFSYQDYLRILLLMKNENTKLRRIMDLIQLNMQADDKDFALSHYHTIIEVKADTSIKNLFINSGLLPDSLIKGINNRCHITHSVIQGY